MKIALAGNTSLAFYCLEKLNRAGYIVSNVFMPRKGQYDQFDIVDISPIAGEFNIRQIWLPIPRDSRESQEAIDIDLLIKFEWPDRLKIPAKPSIATLGVNLYCQYSQGQLLDVAAAIFMGQSKTEIHLSQYSENDIESIPIKTSIVDINIFDDVRSLKSKAAIVVTRMLMQYLDDWQGNHQTKLPHSKQIALPKTKVERNIDWRLNVTEIHNLIRALTHPGPGAFGQLGGSKLYIWHGHPFDIDDKVYGATAPGTVLDVIEELGVVVKTARGAFVITKIQPAGSPELSAWVWAYEFHAKPGDYFDVFNKISAPILV